MSDVILRHYLKMPKSVYKFWMTRIKQEMVSLSFHPHHAVKVIEELEEVIVHYKENDVAFKTHNDYIS